MKKRTALIASLISFLPIGQPFLIGTGAFLTSSTEMIGFPQRADARDFHFYFERGFQKGNEGDYYGAISDYTKAIEINPSYADAYKNRGYTKNQLKDYQGAILDFNKMGVTFFEGGQSSKNVCKEIALPKNIRILK